MYFTQFLVAALGLSIANAIPLPALEDGIEARQVTSPSIIASVGYEIDDAMNTCMDATANIARIFKHARTVEEDAATTAAKVQQQFANIIFAFNVAADGIQGDLDDAIRIIGYEEAGLLKSSTDKLVEIANTIAQRAKEINKSEDKAILKLINGDGTTLISALRGAFTPVSVFVHSSVEDPADEGALTSAREDTMKAGRSIDGVLDAFRKGAQQCLDDDDNDGESEDGDEATGGEKEKDETTDDGEDKEGDEDEKDGDGDGDGDRDEGEEEAEEETEEEAEEEADED